MSAEGMVEEPRAELPDGPGYRLRALRESRELSLPRAAVMLHLDESTLEALESDDFDRLPDPVFVQGYLKNYARLLDTPAEPILDAYRRARPGADRPPLKVVRMKREVKSSHLLVRLVTWLIVLGLVSLLVIWWRGYLTWPITAGDRSSEPAAELPAEEEGALEPPEAVYQPPPELPTESGLLALPGTPAEDTGEAPDTVPETAPEGEQPLGESGAGEVAEVALTEAAVVEPAPVPAAEQPTVAQTEGPPAGGPVVEIRFSADCWTDIRDASGRFRLQGVLAGGETRRLEGEPPYRVVLGNADAVEITIDGAAYDLAPHVRANVARFTLDPASP